MKPSEEIQAYEIESTDDFDSEVERFFRKKKFRKLPAQIRKLTDDFKVGNFSGDLLTRHSTPPPYEVYKKRLPNEDTQTSTSGGYRVIYLVATGNHVVGLLAIYYKKETEALSDNYIQGLIDGFLLALLPDDE